MRLGSPHTYSSNSGSQSSSDKPYYDQSLAPVIQLGPRTRILYAVLSLALVVTLLTLPSEVPVLAQGQDELDFVLILDASGSMDDHVAEGRKIDLARDAITQTYDEGLDELGQRAGVLVYQTGLFCGGIPSLQDAWDRWHTEWDPPPNIQPNGATPTGRALQAAMLRLGYIDERGEATGRGSGQIVLISDGMSNCGPDPCSVVQNTETDVIVHTVGFLLADDELAAEKELRCIANVTRGISVTVNNFEEARREIVSIVRVQNVHNHPKNIPPGFNERYSWWRFIDRDGDGLPDKWEEDGVYFPTFSNDVVIGEEWLNLPRAGANPDQKDLFVYYDWEEGSAYSRRVFDLVKYTFMDAPFDRGQGITVNFIKGKEIPSDQLPAIGDGKDLTDMFEEVTELSGFSRSRWTGSSDIPQLAKYVLIRSECSDCRFSGKVNSIPGSFAVSLVGGDDWCRGDIEALCRAGGSDRVLERIQATVLMHELGHLLGLRHHGKYNCPNDSEEYKSIMSYAYSVTGIPQAVGGTELDFSRETRINLDWKVGTFGTTPIEDESCQPWFLRWALPPRLNGPNDGSLTFVPGQFGQNPDFYRDRNDKSLRFAFGSVPEEKDLVSRIRSSSPEALEAIFEEFGVREVPRVLLDPCGAAPDPPLVDIPRDSVAFDDVACIYNLGVTKGTGPNTYSPRGPVTRAQMAAFLARLHYSFSSAPVCSDLVVDQPPFVDVSEKSFAYDDVACIFSLEVTRGTSPSTFSPDDPVTRAQMAAFLARLYSAVTGAPAPVVTHPFSDLAGSFADDDIARIYGLGVTRGTGSSTFSPKTPVTRAQMASFLARLYKVIESQEA